MNSRPTTPFAHRTHRPGSARDQLQKQMRQKVSQGALESTLHEAIKLPPGERQDEWLAVKIVDFFNEINRLYSLIADKCTEEAFPKMSAGVGHEFAWTDGTHEPVVLSAPEYFSRCMAWVENQLNDEEVFPKTTFDPRGAPCTPKPPLKLNPHSH